MWKSPARFYLAPDGAISEKPVSGGSLLVPAGAELPEAEARRLGLIPAEGEVTADPESEIAGVEEEAAEGEAVSAPPKRGRRR